MGAQHAMRCITIVVLAAVALIGRAEEPSPAANPRDAERVQSAIDRKAEAELAERQSAVAEARAAVTSCERRLQNREADAAKATEALTRMTALKGKVEAAAKRLEEANEQVRKQRRRATEAALKEQEVAQKEYNDLKRTISLPDLEAQIAEAGRRRATIERDVESMRSRLSDLQGRCAEAEKSLEAPSPTTPGAR